MRSRQQLFSSKEEDPVKRDYEIKKGKAKSVIDQSLDYLVSHVYSDLDLIVENAESDADILALLTGAVTMLPGTEPNRDAAAKVEEYLEMQDRKHLPTSMADVQKRYQAIPYGWREIDIAAVVALLIVGQKVTIKYAGSTVQPNNPKLPDMLREKERDRKDADFQETGGICDKDEGSQGFSAGLLQSHGCACG